jgi:hypothetical protein
MTETAGAGGAGIFARRTDWIEVFSTLLLAMATVATAWSGYQATRWSGEQAIAFSAANAARVESTRASTRAGQLTQIDIALFMQWVDAYARHEKTLSDFYFKRFREEFRPALDAWLATKPLKNPDAPLSPFSMPEYKLADAEKADRLAAEAGASTDLAKLDNQRSDNYVLGVVLFATSLFFAGISTKLASTASRVIILALGYVVFFATIAWILTFPVSISI